MEIPPETCRAVADINKMYIVASCWTIIDTIAFCCLKRPDKLWGSTSFLFYGYRGSFPGVKLSGLKFNNSPPLLPRLRMNGTISLHLPKPLWCRQGRCYLAVYIFIVKVKTTEPFGMSFVKTSTNHIPMEYIIVTFL